MLKDEILEKIFSNKEMQKIPIGCQSTAVSVFEDVLEELRKENPYANISDFLSTYGREIFDIADDLLRRFMRVA